MKNDSMILFSLIKTIVLAWEVQDITCCLIIFIPVAFFHGVVNGSASLGIMIIADGNADC
ncbi:hypothetical protein ACLIBG_13145 [Virgibacillus sp. W0181]|uniref:hypothetical protein n=1 Tax=Virgibacillus sp. W0181 TaxID=3391581 RepID=UPI003F48EF58